MMYFDSEKEKIEFAKQIAAIETENKILKEQLASRNETTIKYFEMNDKEQIKRVLKVVYKCKDIDKMSDDELVFCYIAKTLKSLENFCEIAESAETELYARISKIENALKHASDFNEFKAFVMELENE